MNKKGLQPQEYNYKILKNDFTDDHIHQAIELTLQYVSQSMKEKDICSNLKREFESKYNDGSSCWQVICGEMFGCSLTHKTKSIISFQVTKKDSTFHVYMFQSA
jgi:trehalose/maltose hydrolase-like predicted phosphorylase